MEDKDIMVRVLIPSTTAEIITSNGGQHLAEFTIINKVKVKISRRDEFYPGTFERLCQIIGEVSNVITAIYTITYMTYNDVYLDEQRKQEIKIIIHNDDAGRIIGRGGKHLRTIMQHTGSTVNVSPKHNSEDAGDRCITIKGNPASNSKACKMLLTIMGELDDDNNNVNHRFMRSTVEVMVKLYNPEDRELNFPDTLACCGYGREAIHDIMTAFNTLSAYGLLSVIKSEGTETGDTNQDQCCEIEKKPYRQTDGSRDEFRIHSHIRIVGM